MRIEGKPLFSRGLLADHLEEFAVLRASEAISLIASARRAPSRLAMRRAVLAAIVLPDPPMLAMAEISIVAETRGEGRVMTCTIPYSGQERWFDLAAPAWPALRTPRGLVDQECITISAYAWNDEAEWLPTILAAELAAVQANLDAQHRLVDRLEREPEAWVRTAMGVVPQR